MQIKLYSGYEKSYKVRIASNKKLVLQTEQRIALFKVDCRNPILKDHGLTGAKRKLRAFSVSRDIRIVYMPISDTEVIFINIGSHNQVY